MSVSFVHPILPEGCVGGKRFRYARSEQKLWACTCSVSLSLTEKVLKLATTIAKGVATALC